jgi:hypothetical protein
VEAYLRSVIDYDLRAMAEGRISAETTDAYGRLWSVVTGAHPHATPSETALLGRALDKVETVGEQRRIRILISLESLPPVVWVILLIGGAIILYGSSVVSLRHGRPATEVLAAVAAMLTVVLFAIYTMDQPFRHGFTGGVSSYEALWQMVRAPSGDLVR